MKRKIHVAPSILACDFGRIADEAKRIEEAGADSIHVDIMDGHFVPNLSLGPKALAAINRATDLYLDVHIMVYNPFDYIERLVESGADSITFHFEATEDVEDTIDFIRKCNVKAGLAFCPETSESMMTKYIDKVDMMLIMTVHPGFGGQAFIEEQLEKIRFVRGLCDKIDYKAPDGEELKIQVDGGIDDVSAKKCVEAGANVLVSGSYMFKGDMQEKINGMKAL